MLETIENTKLKDSATLWRYMDYDKFLALMLTEELYFSAPGNQVDDLNEGSNTRRT
ncbi:hypothetical protein [Paenibacillus humicus]|uniref:hypothetical protein n=1 Tax=Paenibacillus humicus TaxID=412861 RepID=UPI003F163CD2